MYLGAAAVRGRGFSGEVLGENPDCFFCIVSVTAGIGFRLYASSILSICTNWPESPRSAINLQTNYTTEPKQIKY